MTSVAKYRTLVRVPIGGGTVITLPDPTDFSLSLDIDRRPYVQADLTFATLPTNVITALDPRTWPLVYLSMFREVEGLPNSGDANYSTNQSSVKTLYCTRIVREGTTWKLTLQSGEVRLDALRRIAPTSVNMATQVGNINQIVSDVCTRAGGFLNGFVGTAPNPTGDAALWNPGESGSDLLDPILEASGLRVYADGAQEYMVAPTGEHSGFGVTGTLVISDAVSLHSLRRTLASDSELGWYDAVMIKYEYTNSSGTVVRSYDRYPTNGVNTRALFLTRERAQPAGSAAKAIWRRSSRRGTTYELDMALLPQVTPGWTVELHDPIDGSVQTGYQIKSIDFDYAKGSMTLALQPPTPEA